MTEGSDATAGRTRRAWVGLVVAVVTCGVLVVSLLWIARHVEVAAALPPDVRGALVLAIAIGVGTSLGELTEGEALSKALLKGGIVGLSVALVGVAIT